MQRKIKKVRPETGTKKKNQKRLLTSFSPLMKREAAFCVGYFLVVFAAIDAYGIWITDWPIPWRGVLFAFVLGPVAAVLFRSYMLFILGLTLFTKGGVTEIGQRTIGVRRALAFGCLTGIVDVIMMAGLGAILYAIYETLFPSYEGVLVPFFTGVVFFALSLPATGFAVNKLTKYFCVDPDVP